MGAAHAHLLVVARLAQARLAGVEVHWVTRLHRVAYSGMLSGWVANEYPAEECTVDLLPLAAAAGVHLHPAGATAVDAARRTVTLGDGTQLGGDVLCLGVGAGLRGAQLPGVQAHALDVKATLARLSPLPKVAGPWAVVGAGLGGVELALCLRAVSGHVTLVAEEGPVPPDGPLGLVRAVERALSSRHVSLVRGRAAAVTSEAVLLASGEAVPAEAVLWATGPAPQRLLQSTGLQLGPTGGVRVAWTLQSTSHPCVFATGDCADLPTPVPKSGVYSVREAPVLWHNLTAVLRGKALRSYRPQRQALALVNCGDGTALLAWGCVAGRGRLFRAWKHRLDTRFLKRLRPDG